jgi:hypothetical protein
VVTGVDSHCAQNLFQCDQHLAWDVPPMAGIGWLCDKLREHRRSEREMGTRRFSVIAIPVRTGDRLTVEQVVKSAERLFVF